SARGCTRLNRGRRNRRSRRLSMPPASFFAAGDGNEREELFLCGAAKQGRNRGEVLAAGNPSCRR
ncbi:hypothetical protein U1Q18_001317, partial [Sarracenia purpurea var. burkii]